MPKKTEHPLNRKYRQTAFDRRAKRMTVYDFTRPMTPAQRTSLFATVRHAIHRAIESHHLHSKASPQTPHNASQHETWWQFLRRNRKQYKRIL